jgi:hypothetical protein
MNHRIRTVFISALAGIGTAIVGWYVATFIAETLFNGLSREASSVYGWATYLSVVVVVCTGIILSKINKE